MARADEVEKLLKAGETLTDVDWPVERVSDR
jgi:hypothetical protein